MDEECLDNSSLIKEKKLKDKTLGDIYLRGHSSHKELLGEVEAVPPMAALPPQPAELLAIFFILHPSMKIIATTTTMMLPTYIVVLICDFLRKDYVFTQFLCSFTLYHCFQIVTFLRH